MAALSDLRIIDLSTNVTGPFCTKLFADYGADVVKVESTDEVDEARTLGPFSSEDENPEASGMFLYLNTNKRSVTLNLGSERKKYCFGSWPGRQTWWLRAFLPAPWSVSAWGSIHCKKCGRVSCSPLSRPSDNRAPGGTTRQRTLCSQRFQALAI